MNATTRAGLTAAASALALAVAACGAGSSNGASTTPAATTPAPARTSPPATALAAALKPAGLGVTGLIVYTVTTDPNHLMGRQGGYSSKVAWADPAAMAAGSGDPASDPGGTEYGGGIEVFPDVADAVARLAELKGFKPPFGDGYDDLAGTAVLRLSQYLTPNQARAYETAFRAAAG
jgi:hypothetical protein